MSKPVGTQTIRRSPVAVADPGAPDIRTPNRLLMWLARTVGGSFLASLFWACAWMVSLALTPYAIGRAVDSLTQKDFRGILVNVGFIFVLACITALSSILRHRADTVIRLGSSLRTVRLVTARAGWLGSGLRKRVRAGEVVAVGTDDINQMAYLLDTVPQGIAAVVSIIVVAVMLLAASPLLGLTVLLGVPALLFATGPLLRPLHVRAAKRRDSMADVTAQASDIVIGLRVLRGIGGESAFSTRYRRESQRAREASVEVAKIDSILSAAQVLLPGIFVVAVLWLGSLQVLDGTLSSGQLVAFYGYAAFLMMPMRLVTMTIGFAISARVAAGRVIAILALTRDEGGTAAAPDPAGVELAEPDSGLVVAPGALTVIAAADPDEGAALAAKLTGRGPGSPTLGPTPLAELPVDTARDLLMLAENDGMLFSGPLSDEFHGSPERVAAALHNACAADIIATLPQGLDTVVAERGMSFSGGEQQRLRLARALLVDPPILVLVEPTSALDSHTEAMVAERLRAARAGRTTVVVSISPALLRQADAVAYLESGRVVATGTHRELVAVSAGYADTVSRGQG